jgi:ethanolamine ammonia-lyase small subunit
MNEIGALTGCRVLVLLIGERPGLQTHRSLSAYLAFRPKPGDTDAQRNLVCNIHAYGVPPQSAVRRVMGLARTMAALELSGTGVKEEPFRSLPDSPTQHSAGVLGR